MNMDSKANGMYKQNKNRIWKNVFAPPNNISKIRGIAGIIIIGAGMYIKWQKKIQNILY